MISNVFLCSYDYYYYALDTNFFRWTWLSFFLELVSLRLAIESNILYLNQLLSRKVGFMRGLGWVWEEKYLTFFESKLCKSWDSKLGLMVGLNITGNLFEHVFGWGWEGWTRATQFFDCFVKLFLWKRGTTTVGIIDILNSEWFNESWKYVTGMDHRLESSELTSGLNKVCPSKDFVTISCRATIVFISRSSWR